MARGDAELASVMRKLLAWGEESGYTNSWANLDGSPYITVDCSWVPITEEELQVVQDVMEGTNRGE